MSGTALLIGLGHLGGPCLQLLAREQGLGAPRRVVATSRHRETGEARCNLARLGAVSRGPEILYEPLDLGAASTATDNGGGVARLGELLDRYRPDIVLSTASMQTWWLADRLPPKAAAALRRARFGAWLPLHLSVQLRVMRALDELRARASDSEVAPSVVVASFPDVVGPVLTRLGVPPTCGVGNLDEIIPKLRLLAAPYLGLAPNRAAGIDVLLVAHHAFEPATFGAPMPEVPPHWLRLLLDGRDVTDRVPVDELLFAPCPLPPQPASAWLTAAAVVRLTRALLTERDDGDAVAETRLHVPAPAGLPGGYPVLVSRAGVRLRELPGLSRSEAIAINESSHRFDGIEQIEDDGSVLFCEADAAALRETIGYDCPRLLPNEIHDRAHELQQRFRDYARAHGVDL